MPMPSRYARQVILPEFGEAAQERLLGSRVVVTGCGALGGAVATQLVRAGVGRVVVVDRDVVESGNLQRQILFDDDDAAAALPKAEAAAARLRRANPDVLVDAVVADVDRGNVEGLVDGADVVVDGADNFELRILVNEVCVKLGVPFVHGAVSGTYGVQWTILPGDSACYGCLVEEAPPPGAVPTCETTGVLGPTVLAVAALQAAEALKVLTGNRARVRRTLLSFDMWTGSRAEVAVHRNPACPVCGLRRFDHLEGRKGARTTVLCGRDSVQVSAGRGVALEDVAASLPPGTEVKANRYLVRFEAEGLTVTLFADGRAIVQGTADATRARAVLARWVGA